MCQACDLPPETKQLPSPDDHFEMEVFSEEDPHLTIQSARKVTVPGYGQEEHVTPLQSLQNRIVGQQQSERGNDGQGRVVDKYVTQCLSALLHEHSGQENCSLW